MTIRRSARWCGTTRLASRLLAAPAATDGWTRRDVSSHVQSTWRRHRRPARPGACLAPSRNGPGTSPSIRPNCSSSSGFGTARSPSWWHRAPAANVAYPGDGGRTACASTPWALRTNLQGGVDASHFSLTGRPVAHDGGRARGRYSRTHVELCCQWSARSAWDHACGIRRRRHARVEDGHSRGGAAF